MIKEITMPAGGQTTDMSTIGAWLVKTGDKVKRGDELLTVETDKATLSVESFAKGTVLAILAEEGDQAAAGEVIALIGEESDRPQVEERLGGQSKAGLEAAVAAAHVPSGKEEDEYQPIDKSQPSRLACAPEKERAEPVCGKTDMDHIRAMPNAKLLAGEHGVSLRDVAACFGKHNLKRADVQKYIDEAPCMDTAGTEETGCGKASVTEIPLTSMRRTIARRMLESSRNIPVFRASVEVDMEPCISFRTKVNGSKTGLKLSYNDILFKCIDAAVRKYPYVNASYTEDAILLHTNVNIGLAVSLEEGLVVPVVEAVNEKTITEIAKANKSNISLAREGKLAPEDMSGGTITLSNLGMYPVVQFDAIINPPEACILAAGTVHDKPVLKDGRWVAVPVMTLTGSFDHRVVDGAYGAGFLTELKTVIEDPAMALL
ncbi:2-oxo acid dehydrogenase subunit E2 [Clostridium sp. AF15-17LB]|nr:2-oxo acid dehydrogenase subunit E2 [Clostridium sp. AF15-17LB]